MKPLRTTPVADAHIEALDAWWRENREKAPDLFERELSEAFRTIASAPAVGKTYRHRDAHVRRIVMRSTRMHVYYVDQPSFVLVVAVWGAIKGAGPDLSGL